MREMPVEAPCKMEPFSYSTVLGWREKNDMILTQLGAGSALGTGRPAPAVPTPTLLVALSTRTPGPRGEAEVGRREWGRDQKARRGGSAALRGRVLWTQNEIGQKPL